MAAAMPAGLGNGAGSGFFYHPSMRDRVFSPHRFGQANCLLAFEAPRSGLAAPECCSAERLVLRDIDRPFAMPPLSAAKLLLAAFGLDRIRHFVAPNNRQLSEDHSRNDPERPSAVR